MGERRHPIQETEPTLDLRDGALGLFYRNSSRGPPVLLCSDTSSWGRGGLFRALKMGYIDAHRENLLPSLVLRDDVGWQDLTIVMVFISCAAF